MRPSSRGTTRRSDPETLRRPGLRRPLPAWLALLGDARSPIRRCATLGLLVASAGARRHILACMAHVQERSAMTAATERVVVLMTRAEKRAMEAKAKRMGSSAAELVRRSVEAFD